MCLLSSAAMRISLMNGFLGEIKLDKGKDSVEKNNAIERKINGWVQLSNEIKYENSWIRVSHHDVLRPNGTPGIYGVVHFKHRAVGIIPLDDNGNTWLVQQTRYALNAVTWEIPEGGATFMEEPLAAAKRELEEEVGIKAEHWKELMHLHTSNSVTNEEATIYVAKGIKSGVQKLEDSEDICVKKLPLSEAIDMVKSGQITDAMSVAGLLRLGLDYK